VIRTQLEDNTGYDMLGARLAQLRRAKGLSKSDLAGQLGVTATSICYWEQGRSRPRLARIEALAALLGTSPAELIRPQQPSPAVEPLSETVARMRAEIARAAGTSPAKVHITIEM